MEITGTLAARIYATGYTGSSVFATVAEKSAPTRPVEGTAMKRISMQIPHGVPPGLVTLKVFTLNGKAIGTQSNPVTLFVQ